MFYHKGCNGQLLAQVNNIVGIFANVSTSSTSLNISGLNIVKRGDEQTGIKFYCSDCDKGEIELSDSTAYFICHRCGTNFKISDGKIPEESGGIFCTSCTAKLFKDKENIIDLTSIINKVILK